MGQFQSYLEFLIFNRSGTLKSQFSYKVVNVLKKFGQLEKKCCSNFYFFIAQLIFVLCGIFNGLRIMTSQLSVV